MSRRTIDRASVRTGRTKEVDSTWTGLAGVAVGAALAWCLDPQCGRRRRAHLRDKMFHALRGGEEGLEKATRDLAHRARGAAHETAQRFRDVRADDRILEGRVRSELGRVCSHPSAIEVFCRDAVVELRGPILRAEQRRVLSAIASVPGVREVDDHHLELHRDANGIPALQGGARRKSRFELLQSNWAPGPRLLTGMAGFGMLASGVRRRTPAGLGVGLAGLGLLLRSATNLEMKRLIGIGAGPRAIDVVKDIHVQAPVEEVFTVWSALENFPRFMRHVKQVRRISDDRYHWKVEGPAGIPVEWDAEISAFVPSQLLGWRSVPGALVRSAGKVRFDPDEKGGTRIHIQLHYNPPAGAIGHAFAKLLGADPKKEMDDDLVRFKSLLENGKATGRGETVTRDEIEMPKHSKKM
jgi:uncharacterized membrane protein